MKELSDIPRAISILTDDSQMLYWDSAHHSAGLTRETDKVHIPLLKSTLGANFFPDEFFEARWFAYECLEAVSKFN